MELKERQSRLARALAERAQPPELELLPGGRLSAREALEVYRLGYVARLSDALAETFAACLRLLGRERFYAACADYIAAHRSESYNLSDYGERFGELLDARERGCGELARFEWEFKRLFHLAAPRPAPPESLAAAGPSASFSFITASGLLRHEHRVYRFWSRKCERLEPGPERVALVKRGLEIVAYELGEPEFALLESLRGGATIAEALVSVPGLDEPTVARAFGFLGESSIIKEVL